MGGGRFDPHNHATWIRLAIALVWIVFGLVFKALDVVPRHRRIVARVVGEARARTTIVLVAAGEIAIGLWMIDGRHLALCVALQTATIAAMNTLEIRYARDLLLAPIAMLCANAVLLGFGWYVVSQYEHREPSSRKSSANQDAAEASGASGHR